MNGLANADNKTREFVQIAFGDSRRDDKTETWRHSERVAFILRSHGIVCPVTLYSAWCHDVVEDCSNIGLHHIYEFFKDIFDTNIASQIRSVVSELTRESGGNFEQRQYLLIQKCKKMSPEAKLVKLADRCDNLFSMHNSTWTDKRKIRYVNAAQEIVKAMEPIPYNGRRLAYVVSQEAVFSKLMYV